MSYAIGLFSRSCWITTSQISATRGGLGLLVVALIGLAAARASAGVGNPQIMTEHPYFAGELSCSSVQRIVQTAYEQYRARTKIDVTSDQHKALAAWYWRCTHFWHTEDAHLDYWGTGFRDGEGPEGGDLFSREFWLGLFSQGACLCGPAHAQLSALMQEILGPGTARIVGVVGHNSHEVWLTGGAYEAGRWAILDADICCVVFDEQGRRLCSMTEVIANPTLLDRTYKPERQQGWPLSGISPDNAAGTLKEFRTAEYNAGYFGAPPVLSLPAGMTFRRYPGPGLGDKTYCFFAANYNEGGIPGPVRDRTWARDPAAMYQGPGDAGKLQGPPLRYGNGVFTYRPDFADGSYRQAVLDESAEHVTFQFSAPYLIACTPPDESKWGIYKSGGTNGLVLRGRADCPVGLSTDWGKSWTDCGRFRDGMDLTDLVKGRRQYLLRLGAGATKLAEADLGIQTVVQTNPAVFPQLTSDGSRVSCLVTGEGIKAVGPFVDQVQAHIVQGQLRRDSQVVMKVATPRGEKIREVFVAAHVLSGVPPSAEVRYQVEMSGDGGKTWQAVVKDWRVIRREPEPDDFWSQGFVWGRAKLTGPQTDTVLVRFSNDGRIAYGRCEVHLVYEAKDPWPLLVRYFWSDQQGEHVAEHTYRQTGDVDSSWVVPTGKQAVTKWVEFVPTKAGSPASQP